MSSAADAAVLSETVLFALETLLPVAANLLSEPAALLWSAAIGLAPAHRAC
jgi:hypothetical protein